MNERSRKVLEQSLLIGGIIVGDDQFPSEYSHGFFFVNQFT